MASSPQHFGSQVSCASTERMRQRGFLGQPEISQTSVAFGVKHHISRLQVPINDFGLVQLLNRQYYLGYVFSGQILIQLSFLLDQFEHIPSGAILHDQEELLGGLEGVVKPHHKGMVDSGQNLSFSHAVAQNVLPHDHPLVEHFHGIALSILSVLDQVDLSEGALAQDRDLFEGRKPDFFNLPDHHLFYLILPQLLSGFGFHQRFRLLLTVLLLVLLGSRGSLVALSNLFEELINVIFTAVAIHHRHLVHEDHRPLVVSLVFGQLRHLVKLLRGDALDGGLVFIIFYLCGGLELQQDVHHFVLVVAACQVQGCVALVVLQAVVCPQFQQRFDRHFVTQDAPQHQRCPLLIAGAPIDIDFVVNESCDDLYIAIAAADCRQVDPVLALIGERTSGVDGMLGLASNHFLNEGHISLVAGFQEPLLLLLFLAGIFLPNGLEQSFYFGQLRQILDNLLNLVIAIDHLHLVGVQVLNQKDGVLLSFGRRFLQLLFGGRVDERFAAVAAGLAGGELGERELLLSLLLVHLANSPQILHADYNYLHLTTTFKLSS